MFHTILWDSNGGITFTINQNVFLIEPHLILIIEAMPESPRNPDSIFTGYCPLFIAPFESTLNSSVKS